MTNVGEKYECYSKKTYGYLTMKGFRYEYTFVHKTTGRKCYVYIMTEALSESLTEWSLNK